MSPDSNSSGFMSSTGGGHDTAQKCCQRAEILAGRNLKQYYCITSIHLSFNFYSNFNYFFSQPLYTLFQGLRHIQIGCKQSFSQIYMACAGTNMQKLVDLLETMFDDLDLEDIDLEQLETDAIKALCQEAASAEEAAAMAPHGSILADKIMHVRNTSVPIPVKFGIPIERN